MKRPISYFATALEYKQDGVNTMQFHFGTDGSGFDAIIKPVGGCRNQVTAKDLEPVLCEDGRKRHGFQTLMKGMDVCFRNHHSAQKHQETRD